MGGDRGVLGKQSPAVSESHFPVSPSSKKFPRVKSQSIMALAPATRLGPYEILQPLGAGRMGEVYRARYAASPLTLITGWDASLRQR